MVDAEYTPSWKCGKCGKGYYDMFQAEDCCEEPKKEGQIQNETKAQVENESEVQTENESNAEVSATL